MPTPLAFGPAVLTSLKIGAADAIKFQLLLDKVPGNPSQMVNLQSFSAKYGTTDDKVMPVLQALQSAKALKIAYGTFDITWAENPTVNTTAAQVQSDWNNQFLDDPSYYSYLALALTKGPAMLQTVDPTVFAAAPWNLDADTLVTEIQKFASRRPTTANPMNNPPFSVDYGDVTLTWIADHLGNAA